MTGQQPDIQWYIARDGKQHGPLSDIEMRTFVAQGHLKPTDLIWRAGFADWRPAPAVLPFQSPAPAAPPAPPAPAPAPIPDLWHRGPTTLLTAVRTLEVAHATVLERVLRERRTPASP